MSTGNNPFAKQLAQAKQGGQPIAPAEQRWSQEDPVKNVTYVYGKDILMMGKQEVIESIRRLELYRAEIKDIETSAKALDFHVAECDKAINDLAGHLSVF